jgi:hypothetical protein
MIDNDKQKMGGTMFEPEIADAATLMTGAKQGHPVPARGHP